MDRTNLMVRTETPMTITFDIDQAGWESTTSYPDGTLLPFKLDKIVIHWGGNTDPDGPDDVATFREEADILRSWQRFHMAPPREWTDIAYNFAVGNTGLSYRLRGFNRSGATSGDFEGDGIPENEEALALVWIGGTAGTPTVEAYETMGRLIREVFAEYGVVPVTVHSDHKATACPGDEWRAWVDTKGWERFEPPFEWFESAWTWAENAHIMTEDSDPHKTVTKQEMAAFLRRTVRHIDKGGHA